MWSPIFQPKRFASWLRQSRPAVLEKVGPLVIRDDEFGDDFALVFDINDELRKEVLLFLIETPPNQLLWVMALTPGMRRIFIAVGERQRLDDGDTIDDDQAVGARRRPRPGQMHP